jgi:hypothetical protein
MQREPLQPHEEEAKGRGEIMYQSEGRSPETSPMGRVWEGGWGGHALRPSPPRSGGGSNGGGGGMREGSGLG